MLFEFNRFWKFVLIIVGTWATYGLFGYEFSVVTLLGFILALNLISK